MNVTQRASTLLLVGILLSASIGKLLVLVFSPQVLWDQQVPTPLYAIISLWELLVCAGLISRRLIACTWWGCFALLSTFLIHGIANFAGEQSNCNCFGLLQLSSHAELGVTVTAFIALILSGYPGHDILRAELSGLFQADKRNEVFRFAFSGIVLALSLSVMSLKVVRSALRPVQPAVSIIYPDRFKPFLSIGKVRDETMKTIELTILNSSDSNKAIVGARVSCRCISLQSLPLELPPGIPVVYRATIDLSEIHGKFVRGIELYSNEPNSSVLVANITGEVVK